MAMFGPQPSLTSMMSVPQQQAGAFLALTSRILQTQLEVLQSGLAAAQTVQESWTHCSFSMLQPWTGAPRSATPAVQENRAAELSRPAHKTDPSGIPLLGVPTSDPGERDEHAKLDASGVPLIGTPRDDDAPAAVTAQVEVSSIPILGLVAAEQGGQPSWQDPTGLPIIGPSREDGNAAPADGLILTAASSAEHSGSKRPVQQDGAEAKPRKARDTSQSEPK